MALANIASYGNMEARSIPWMDHIHTSLGNFLGEGLILESFVCGSTSVRLISLNIIEYSTPFKTTVLSPGIKGVRLIECYLNAIGYCVLGIS